MAARKQPARSSGSRTSNSRSSGGRAPASRSSGRSGYSEARSSGRSGNTASRSASGRKSSGRSNSRNTSSRGRAKNNSSPKSGMSSFYKAMVLLAICGIAAALYAGGHLSNLSSVIADFSASGITDGFIGNSSEPTTSSDGTKSTTSTAAASTTTTTTTASTTKSTTTTTTTTTTKKTTTTTVADSGKNAKHVKSPNYESPYYIVVFTGSQSVVVYSKDSDGNYTVQSKAFKCSTGASGTPTRTGMYSILRSYRWRLLMGGVYGQYCSGISSSYLFHSVLYDDKDNSTLYENSYKNLGTAASHGCIRLSVRDAKWIYDNCPHGTQVHIVNAEGPKGADLPPLKEGNKYRGWEPTDPDKNSPYNKSSSDSTEGSSSTANSNDDSASDESITTETTLPPPVVG